MPGATACRPTETKLVELMLPKASQPKRGKTWAKTPGATRIKEYRVYRYDPDVEANPRIDTYFVDRDDCGPMVLDALMWIKNKVDPTLTLTADADNWLAVENGELNPMMAMMTGKVKMKGSVPFATKFMALFGYGA